MDSMVFELKSSELIAHCVMVSNHDIHILRSCYQLQHHSQPMAELPQFGMEVASL